MRHISRVHIAQLDVPRAYHQAPVVCHFFSVLLFCFPFAMQVLKRRLLRAFPSENEDLKGFVSHKATSVRWTSDAVQLMSPAITLTRQSLGLTVRSLFFVLDLLRVNIYK